MGEILETLSIPLGAVVLLQGFLLLLVGALWWRLGLQLKRIQREHAYILDQERLWFQQLHADFQKDILQHISQGHLKTQQLVGNSVSSQMKEVREQLTTSFTQHSNGLTAHLKTLNNEVREHLIGLTTQVNHRLSEGFEKNSNTFADIVKRLTIIDEAQKRISELSTHVVSLQDVLTDKRSRGAFGEVQLEGLVSNMIPKGHYQMQHGLSNGKRVDCMIFLPNPTGSVAIDAKFPLETYQKMHVANISMADKKAYSQQFRQDIQKHIKDIAEKYIIPNETSDGAVMFIPAEAIFAEIHANFPELVELAHKQRVWLVSPSTLMAVLTTARAVLKDDATRKQIHIIQKHLQTLAEDFQRFDKRMDKLSRHINQAHQDVAEVNTSAKKIAQRFQKIEQVELEEPLEAPLS